MPHIVIRHLKGEQASLATKRVRHLPVLGEAKFVGFVFVGDPVKWITSAQNAEIAQIELGIAGGGGA